MADPTKISNEELADAPCPFCGSQVGPREVGTYSNQFYTHCDGCGAGGPAGQTIWEAKRLWNTRAPAQEKGR